MVEKNSGVPSLNEVAAPVQQPEQTESVTDVGTTTPHTKRTRKSKIKPDTETDTVANKDPGNAEQSNIPAVSAGGDNPTPVTTTPNGGNKDPVVAEAAENKVVVADQKRKHKRPRPLPPIEHKRVVHYYRQAKPVKKKDRRSGDKDRRDGSGSRNRDDGYAKKSKYDDRDYSDDDDDDDDEEELLSDSDWDVDSGDDSDPSNGDSDDEEPVKKRESGQDKRRDDGGRFAPVHAVMQYRVV